MPPASDAPWARPGGGVPSASGVPWAGPDGRGSGGGASGGVVAGWGGGARTAGRRSAAVGASADAKLAVRRFLHLCVEVLNGYRPPAHLRRLALPMEAAEVVSQGLAGAQRIATLRKAGRTVGRRPPRRMPPVAIACLKLCQPTACAVEAAAALVTAERTWGLALRMELHNGVWAATTLRLI